MSANKVLLQQARYEQTIIAIGPGTEQALLSVDLSVDQVPETHSSDGILSLPILSTGTAHKIIIFSEAASPSPLKKALNLRGHQAVHIATYRQQPRNPSTIANELIPILQQLSTITTHSIRGLQQLLTVTETESLNMLKEKTLLVTSKNMEEMARKNGFQSVICSESNQPAIVFKTLIQHWQGAPHE